MTRNSLEDIRAFLAHKRLALIGASRNPKDFNNAVLREFALRGYDVVPVNPYADQIEGRPCAHRLSDITPPVKAALVMLKSADVASVGQEALAHGVECLWLYRAVGQGAVDPAVVDAARAAGVRVVAGECPLMFLEDPVWIHRCHAVLKKITGSYPVLH